MNRKKLLWLGGVFFARSFDPERYDVVFHGYKEPSVYDWDDLCRLSGGEPDVVVLGDNSLPPALLGVESYPCLTVLYCIDTHIHSWQPIYAQGFDIVLVSLRDHMERFRGGLLDPADVHWSPAFAKDDDEPLPAEIAWDVLFVGNVDKQLMPLRCALLEKLAQRMPGRVQVMQGSYKELFAKGRVILNIADRGDLNFRVFEALGCGGCLATPMMGHGLLDLFEDGRDLFTYPQDDISALTTLLQRLLDDDELRASAAAAGLDAINAGHRARHRAANLDAIITAKEQGEGCGPRRQRAAAAYEEFLKPLYLHWAQALKDKELKSRYLSAARSTR